MMTITMPRGDIRPVVFTVSDNDGGKTDVEIAEIYFTVKKQYADKRFLFQKRLSAGTIVADEAGNYTLTIEAEDTDDLDVSEYVFDIELVGDGLKQTTVGKLVLTDEVTRKCNEV